MNLRAEVRRLERAFPALDMSPEARRLPARARGLAPPGGPDPGLRAALGAVGVPG